LNHIISSENTLVFSIIWFNFPHRKPYCVY
jgi:hypothetical protein